MPRQGKRKHLGSPDEVQSVASATGDEVDANELLARMEERFQELTTRTSDNEEMLDELTQDFSLLRQVLPGERRLRRPNGWGTGPISRRETRARRRNLRVSEGKLLVRELKLTRLLSGRFLLRVDGIEDTLTKGYGNLLSVLLEFAQKNQDGYQPVTSVSKSLSKKTGRTVSYTAVTSSLSRFRDAIPYLEIISSSRGIRLVLAPGAIIKIDDEIWKPERTAGTETRGTFI